MDILTKDFCLSWFTIFNPKKSVTPYRKHNEVKRREQKVDQIKNFQSVENPETELTDRKTENPGDCEWLSDQKARGHDTESQVGLELEGPERPERTELRSGSPHMVIGERCVGAFLWAPSLCQSWSFRNRIG